MVFEQSKGVLPGAPLVCELAARMAAAEIGVTVQDVLQPSRHNRASAGARAIAMYLVHVGLGVPVREVASGFRRHRSTVAHACQRVEERREAAEWDSRITILEDGLRRAFTTLKEEVRHAA